MPSRTIFSTLEYEFSNVIPCLLLTSLEIPETPDLLKEYLKMIDHFLFFKTIRTTFKHFLTTFEREYESIVENVFNDPVILVSKADFLNKILPICKKIAKKPTIFNFYLLQAFLGHVILYCYEIGKCYRIFETLCKCAITVFHQKFLDVFKYKKFLNRLQTYSRNLNELVFRQCRNAKMIDLLTSDIGNKQDVLNILNSCKYIVTKTPLELTSFEEGIFYGTQDISLQELRQNHEILLRNIPGKCLKLMTKPQIKFYGFFGPHNSCVYSNTAGSNMSNLDSNETSYLDEQHGTRSVLSFDNELTDSESDEDYFCGPIHQFHPLSPYRTSDGEIPFVHSIPQDILQTTNRYQNAEASKIHAIPSRLPPIGGNSYKISRKRSHSFSGGSRVSEISCKCSKSHDDYSTSTPKDEATSTEILAPCNTPVQSDDTSLAEISKSHYDLSSTSISIDEAISTEILAPCSTPVHSDDTSLAGISKSHDDYSSTCISTDGATSPDLLVPHNTPVQFEDPLLAETSHNPASKPVHDELSSFDETSQNSAPNPVQFELSSLVETSQNPPPNPVQPQLSSLAKTSQNLAPNPVQLEVPSLAETSQIPAPSAITRSESLRKKLVRTFNRLRKKSVATPFSSKTSKSFTISDFPQTIQTSHSVSKSHVSSCVGTLPGEKPSSPSTLCDTNKRVVSPRKCTSPEAPFFHFFPEEPVISPKKGYSSSLSNGSGWHIPWFGKPRNKLLHYTPPYGPPDPIAQKKQKIKESQQNNKAKMDDLKLCDHICHQCETKCFKYVSYIVNVFLEDFAKKKYTLEK